MTILSGCLSSNDRQKMSLIRDADQHTESILSPAKIIIFFDENDPSQSARNIDFGVVPIGQAVSRVIIMKNIGEKNATISINIVTHLSAEENAPLAVDPKDAGVQGSCAFKTNWALRLLILQGGESCHLTTRFLPSNITDFNRQFNFTYDDGTGDKKSIGFTLSGNGIAVGTQFSAAAVENAETGENSIDFGITLLGVVQTRFLKVSNIGLIPVDIKNIKLNLTHSQTSITGVPNPFSLSPQGIVIPSQLTQPTCDSLADENNSFSLPIQGECLIAVSFSPTDVNLQALANTLHSIVISVVYQNKLGDVTLDIPVSATASDGSTPTPTPSPTPTPTPSSTPSPTLADLMIQIDGVEVSSYDFPDVPVGLKTTKELTVTNRGTAILNLPIDFDKIQLDMVAVLGSTSELFAPQPACSGYVDLGLMSLVLTPGLSCTISARFSPVNEIFYTEEFNIDYEDGNTDATGAKILNTLRFDLTGKGIAFKSIYGVARIFNEAGGIEFTFDNTRVGATTTKDATIINLGEGPLWITDYETVFGKFDVNISDTRAGSCSMLQVDSGAMQLNPGESCFVQILFSPTAVEDFKAILRVNYWHDLGAQFTTRDLTGTGF